MSEPAQVSTEHVPRRLIGRAISLVAVAGAVVIGLVVWRITNQFPRTDDAWVLANLIGIAPEVNGPITAIHVRDNQFVKSGDLLFEIDARPFEYALARAKSDQVTLEKQILNEERVIAGQRAAVASSEASLSTSRSNVTAAEANISAARAAVGRAESGVTSAEADYKLATDTLRRLEPLLVRQFVTADQVDRQRTAKQTAAETVRQAQAQLALTRAQLEAALAQRTTAGSNVHQSQAQLQQSIHNVTLLDPMLAERPARAAAVQTAEYNLSRCRVYAPFDARVTDMNISQGAYAHAGQAVFTLIDVRNWYAMGNFRESQLKDIQPGMVADVYVMSQPTVRFSGTVESAAYGVAPQDIVLSQGLPAVQRSINWVHLATRYPVRVRVDRPPAELFRIGESAVVIIRGRVNTADRPK
jgi:multidrug efflux system membrane fusion protein